MELTKPLKRLLFDGSYLVAGKPSVVRHYKKFMKTQWRPYDWLRDMQIDQLNRLVRFSDEHVLYYRRLFESLGLKPGDLKELQELQKLPILTKQIIKQHRDEMMPQNLRILRYVHGHTGGSTGEPLEYLMSIEDYARAIALLHRGWSYAGYEPGDRVAMIAGHSLVSSAQSRFRRWAVSGLRNWRYYPCYVMDDRTKLRYVEHLNSFEPDFLRGYPSSIYVLASFIKDKNLSIGFRPRAVLTTAEKLLEGQRRVIEEVFRTEVFDNYGLYDGGVSAFECKAHNGMHVDMERAILEVVDEDGQQVVNKPGRILATSLYNYAFPFIRYDTGDCGVLSQSHCKCDCGRDLPILAEIRGRTTDVLELAGRSIRFPTVLFAELDVEQYQVIQDAENSLVFRIVKGETYGCRDEMSITQWVRQRIGSVNISFEYVPLIEPHEGNKHKFIVDRRHSA